ncbi:hypothetical protein EMCRGX_G002890 [Ephydatia muelleri]|eukprot:Em0001g2647a
MAFRCTKLVQWLAIVALFLETWYALVTGWLPINMSREMYTAVLPLPVYALICFGCYALITIGYRLITFNDCTEAAQELKQEITEAKADLTRRGMKLS